MLIPWTKIGNRLLHPTEILSDEALTECQGDVENSDTEVLCIPECTFFCEKNRRSSGNICMHLQILVFGSLGKFGSVQPCINCNYNWVKQTKTMKDYQAIDNHKSSDILIIALL